MKRKRKTLASLDKDYYPYAEMLLSGDTYGILISKRLLIRPMLFLWIYFFAVFLMRGGGVIFGIVILPSLILLSLFLAMLYPIWHACSISRGAYIFFHIAMLVALRLIAIPVSFLLERLFFYVYYVF